MYQRATRFIIAQKRYAPGTQTKHQDNRQNENASSKKSKANVICGESVTDIRKALFKVEVLTRIDSLSLI